MVTRDRPTPESDADSTDERSTVSASDVLLATASDVERAREMYRHFLASEYPAALVIADEILHEHPDDFMALAIANECREGGYRAPSATGEPAPSGAPMTVPASTQTSRNSELPTAETAVDLTAGYLGAGSRTDRGRQMCQRFLESDHPAALAIAEEILAEHPEDRMARAIVEQCYAAMHEVPPDSSSAESVEVDLEDL